MKIEIKELKVKDGYFCYTIYKDGKRKVEVTMEVESMQDIDELNQHAKNQLNNNS